MKEHTENQPNSQVNTGKLLWLLIGLPVLVVLLLVAFWLLFEHTRQPSAETTYQQPDHATVIATFTIHRSQSRHQFNESTEQTT
jgi:flagellar basal body-associated protein FliL